MAGGTVHGGGLGVHKIYDPRGISSPELIARKERAGLAMRTNPNVAQFRGAQKGLGGTTAHAMEYVQGQEPKVSPQTYAQIQAARRGVAKGMRQAGFAGAIDVTPQNMIQTPSGQVKAIDYIPIQRGEFASGNERALLNQMRQKRGLPPLPKNALIQSSGPVRQRTGVTPAGQLKAMHFGGAPSAQQTAISSPSVATTRPAGAQTRIDRPLADTRLAKKPALGPTRPIKPRTAL